MECLLYKILKFTFKPLFKFLYRPKIIGIDNLKVDGSLVIASNHIHALDPILIIVCSKRVVHFLAKKELFKGMFKPFFYSVGTLPVDRKNKNDDTIKKAEEILKSGNIIGIFPEGTRNRTEKDLLPFKKGAVSFALNTDSMIVPVYIKGDYKILKKGLTIVIGKPYKVKNDMEKENEILKNKILKLKKENNL